MRSRLVRFLGIASLLLLYTCFKAAQLWPDHLLLTVSLTVVLFVAMLGGTFIYRAHAQVFDKTWFRVFVWIGSLAMGLWATFILFSLPFDLLHLLVSGADWIRGADLAETEKTALVFASFFFCLLCLSGGFAILGFFEIARGARVKRVTIRVENLSIALRGFKIAQISDLHVGPTIRKKYVQAVVERVNATEPDLIVVTGDLADAHVESIHDHMQPLQNLKSRYGVFYVTGNHEYYWDAKGILDRIKELGFTALVNENRVIQVGDAKILVAGVTDPMGGSLLAGHAPDPDKAARSVTVTDFKILLAHRPDACIEGEKLGFDLQFSGHTHSGQFFPFSLLIGFAHKYKRGLYRHGRMWVYVNPGTGYWGPANRFGVAPEITLATLQP